VLKLAILRVKLLDCVVCQMHRCSLYIVKGVGIAGHSNVAFSEKVAIVLMGDQHPKSDVKFTLIDQKRPLDVLLDHEKV